MSIFVAVPLPSGIRTSSTAASAGARARASATSDDEVGDTYAHDLVVVDHRTRIATSVSNCFA
jgi:hypothetical protein